MMTRERHGHCGDKPSSTYISWRNMRWRCGNPKASNYHKYGGKGIRVCKRWASFIAFLADMGERPEGMTLDRINSKKNYTKANCRWATTVEQNRHGIKPLTYKGLTLSRTEWAKKANISTSLLSSRLRKGWPMEKVFSPPDPRRPQEKR